MEANKEEEPKHEEVDQEGEESQEEVTGKSKANLNEKLINAVRKNQYEEVEKCLKKKADINYQEPKKKWTPLIWACCQGYYKIVKLLLSRGAAAPYLQVKQQNRHVIPGSTKQMKPNPLHWACFKGHLDVFQILIRAGLHYQDVDSCGNNSVMLSAAGNSVSIFKAFLQIGVDLDCKNSRGHSVKDLTTSAEIMKLVMEYHEAKVCCVSGHAFKEKQKKYWCWVCGRFANEDNYQLQWMLTDLKATQRQKIDGRCQKCWTKASNMKKDLQQAIIAYQEVRLKKTIDSYSNYHDQIQIKFLQRCYQIYRKICVQNAILAYIKSLEKVSDYKVILKSVNKIHQMLKEAQPYNIDGDVIEAAEKQVKRLNAERNLRYEVDNIDTSIATRQGVAKLEEVFSEAESKSVASQYLEVASSIKQKMAKSILAQDLYQMFMDYPQRPDPYPDPLVIDFKSKRPLDPATKKPTDPANLLPKKKKGKKGPQFTIPEWANELKEMNQKIKELQELLSHKDQLGLSNKFVEEAQPAIIRMKRQSRYRKDMDQLQRMVDEANKKKK